LNFREINTNRYQPLVNIKSPSFGTNDILQTPDVTQTPGVTHFPDITQTPDISQTPYVTQTPDVSQTPEIIQTSYITHTPEVENDIFSKTISNKMCNLEESNEMVKESFKTVSVKLFSNYVQNPDFSNKNPSYIQRRDMELKDHINNNERPE
jgi:hypothetical protein